MSCSWLGMLPGTWAYVSAGAFGRAIIVSFSPPSSFWLILPIIWLPNLFIWFYYNFFPNIPARRVRGWLTWRKWSAFDSWAGIIVHSLGCCIRNTAGKGNFYIFLKFSWWPKLCIHDRWTYTFLCAFSLIVIWDTEPWIYSRVCLHLLRDRAILFLTYLFYVMNPWIGLCFLHFPCNSNSNISLNSPWVIFFLYLNYLSDLLCFPFP